MADAAQNRMASRASMADDDPFAELTRIMGFAPRQPVRREPVSRPEVQAAPPPQADLEIDMERELLGEFAADDTAREDVSPPAQDFEPAYADEFEMTDASDASTAAAYGADPEFDLSQEAYGAPDAAAYDNEPAAAEAWTAATPEAPARPADRFEPEVDLPAFRLGDRSHPQTPVQDDVADISTEDALELTLESELGALLGNTSPAQNAYAAPAAADTSFAGRFDAMDPDSGYEAGDDYEAQADERRADLGSNVPPLAEMARRWTQQSAPDARAQHAAPAQAPEDDFDLDFDDVEFDTALSNGLNDGHAALAHPAPAGPTQAIGDKVDPVMPKDGHDPYAALAALSANIHGGTAPRASAAYEAPDIETIDVPEQAVALADDLDLPEFAFEDEPANASSYDDIDAEFASLLNEMNSVDPDASASSRYAEPQAASRSEIDLDQAAMAAAGAGFAAGAMANDGRYAADETYGAASYASRRPEEGDTEFAYDPDAEEDIAPPYQSFAPKPARNKGLMVAALVAGVAVLGGVGALAMSFGGGSTGDVALVKADPAPTKVRPENPGGATIPNQDNKVYDMVAKGPKPAAPEAPIDLPMADDDVDMADADFPAEEGMAPGVTMDDAAAAKGEDRLEQVAAEPGVDSSVEVAAVPPRKVRTMIVKADGTLVAREEVAPAAATPDTAGESMVEPAMAAADPAEVTGANPPAATVKPTQKGGNTPAAAPIAPARPSDQPVDIVGEVQPQQVAALAPAAAGGSWAMQIASQPSEAAAQSSYKDLSRRYASVLGGKQASIVKADIAGKGTYWRVRVAAGSRAEAVKMCESYKAAGGSCFVSK